MSKTDKIKRLERLLSNGFVANNVLRCSINLHNGTYTILEATEPFIRCKMGIELSKMGFDNLVKNRKVQRILNLGKGIKPNE
jgi:hypothetical protein